MLFRSGADAGDEEAQVQAQVQAQDPVAGESKDGSTPAQDTTDLSSQDGEVAARPLGQTAVPFGPFIALGALEWLFFGDAILRWFLP